MEAWKEGILRKFLTIVEGQLERNIMVSKFLVGESMTIADFAVACLVFNILKNDQGPVSATASSILLEFPNFGAYTKRLEKELAKHLESREKKFF